MIICLLGCKKRDLTKSDNIPLFTCPKFGDPQLSGIMVLKVDGNSKIDAHIRSNLGYLVCLSHVITLRAVTNSFFFLTYFPTFVRSMFGVTI